MIEEKYSKKIKPIIKVMKNKRTSSARSATLGDTR